jgi:hypothetical protein
LEKLKMIESLVLPALAKKGIIILSAAELSEVMHPDIYVEDLHMNSLHEGNQLLHAIFQVMD